MTPPPTLNLQRTTGERAQGKGDSTSALVLASTRDFFSV